MSWAINRTVYPDGMNDRSCIVIIVIFLNSQPNLVKKKSRLKDTILHHFSQILVIVSFLHRPSLLSTLSITAAGVPPT